MKSPLQGKAFNLSDNVTRALLATFAVKICLLNQSAKSVLFAVICFAAISVFPILEPAIKLSCGDIVRDSISILFESRESSLHLPS